MSKSLNRQQLIGYVAADPTVRENNGITIASVRLGVTKRFPDRNGAGVEREQTDWFNVVGFAAIGEMMGKMVHQGDQLFVEGETRNTTYTDRNGVKHDRSEVTASTFIILTSKSGRAQGPAQQPQPRPQQPQVPEDINF